MFQIYLKRNRIFKKIKNCGMLFIQYLKLEALSACIIFLKNSLKLMTTPSTLSLENKVQMTANVNRRKEIIKDCSVNQYNRKQI